MGPEVWATSVDQGQLLRIGAWSEDTAGHAVMSFLIEMFSPGRGYRAHQKLTTRGSETC